MQKQLLHSFQQASIGTSLFFILVFILTACGSRNGSSITSSSASSTAISPNTSVNVSTKSIALDGTTPIPSVKLGAQPCPASVSAPTHWDPIIPTKVNLSRVESVTCANLRGNASLQALVNERISGTGHFLNVYVYDNITSANPTQLFKLQGLEHGAAKISGYNTITTAEVDPNSSININQPNAGLTQDLFREFKWFNNAGKFVPVAFPGIFPDLTRYQAESDQRQVSQGHQPWKLDAAMTANALAVTMLKWSTSATTTIISGGGKNDLNAIVNVKSAKQVPGMIQVTMTRLEGNTNGGIWIATAVTSNGMSITAPISRDLLTSPTTVTGRGNAFEGRIGPVTILDHNYTAIGHADANGAIGNGNTTFSTNVSYNSSFKSGVQEGIVALYSYSNADGSIAGAVFVKVLLSA